MIAESAAILCGGRGRRLGSLGERLPKALAPVLGKPILWYILLRLHEDGFRHFVLPLGYLGYKIRQFIDRDLRGFDARIDLIDTGEETSVGRRLSLVRHAIASDDFLLVNGDTLFDFNVADLLAEHRMSHAELTLSSCRVVSRYGLILVDDRRCVVDFVRDSEVDEFIVGDHGQTRQSGFINAGIAVLHRQALEFAGVDNTPEFEQHVYRQIIAKGRAHHFHIRGFWYAIDTQKDLELAESSSERDSRSVGVRALADKLTAYAAKLGVQSNFPISLA